MLRRLLLQAEPAIPDGSILLGIAAIITSLGGLVGGIAALLSGMRRSRSADKPSAEPEADDDCLKELERERARADTAEALLEECNVERLRLLRKLAGRRR